MKKLVLGLLLVGLCVGTLAGCGDGGKDSGGGANDKNNTSASTNTDAGAAETMDSYNLEQSKKTGGQAGGEMGVAYRQAVSLSYKDGDEYGRASDKAYLDYTLKAVDYNWYDSESLPADVKSGMGEDARPGRSYFVATVELEFLKDYPEISYGNIFEMGEYKKEMEMQPFTFDLNTRKLVGPVAYEFGGEIYTKGGPFYKATKSNMAPGGNSDAAKYMQNEIKKGVKFKIYCIVSRDDPYADLPYGSLEFPNAPVRDTIPKDFEIPHYSWKIPLDGKAYDDVKK